MDVVLALIEAVNWKPLSTIDGDAADVPHRLRKLIFATAAPEADAAYWELDNHVIVQGRMFGAAPFVVAPLSVALFSGALGTPARLAVLNLLTEIALGHGHEDESDPDEIVRLARAELLRVSLGLYPLLGDPDAQVRRCARDILEEIEDNEGRRRLVVGTEVGE